MSNAQLICTKKIFSVELIGQSYDFWRACSLLVAWVASFVPGRSKGAYDATRLIIIIMNTVQSQIVVWVLNSNKLIFYSEKKSPTLQNYKVSKYKFTPALALKWYPQWSSGSRWPSKVVWHLCMQPIRIRAINAFATLVFLVWPARIKSRFTEGSLSFGCAYW